MFVCKECNLADVTAKLLAGGVIIFPTETSYGLGCDAANQNAVDRIFEIKNRPQTKSLLVVVPTVAMAKEYLQWNDLLEQLANKYWPGQLTVVGEHNPQSNLAHGVLSPVDTVALRVTGHPIPKYLSGQLGRPLVATSANISEGGDVYSPEQIINIFKNQTVQPDIAMDYGELPKNKPSTIVSVLGNELKILRQGELLVELDEA
jgi:L-threonylcarbamoyladenylate synthase